MSLPQDTRGEAAGSNFFKAETGQTEFLIVGPTITGYQYWRDGADGKAECVRSQTVFDEPIADVRMRDKKDKDGNVVGKEPEKQQFYWAMPVFNFRTQLFEVAQFTQKGIRDDLKALNDNPNWGDPTGRYTVTLTKTGDGFQTKYKVDGNPSQNRQEEIASIMAKFNAAPIDVAGTLFGTAAVEETPAAEEATTPEAPVETAQPEVQTEAPAETVQPVETNGTENNGTDNAEQTTV